MSEQTGKTSKAREKRWTEAEAREALREWCESGLSAVAHFLESEGLDPGYAPRDQPAAPANLPERVHVQVQSSLLSDDDVQLGAGHCGAHGAADVCGAVCRRKQRSLNPGILEPENLTDG